MKNVDTPFWHPSRHADRRGRLIARGRIKAAFRAYFEAHGFIEIETAALQVSPGNEAHLHAFATRAKTDGGSDAPLYLHTSPEFAMKKLLAAGERRIFTFASVYRNRERGPLHSPEFTMLEWYRAEEPYAALKEDCSRLLRIAADVTGQATWAFRGHLADPRNAPEQLSLDDAFRRHADIDLLETLSPKHADRAALAEQVARIGIRVADDDTWSDLFSRVLVERIEPALRVARGPVLLDRYPTHEAALARPAADDPRVAERFELYMC
ncbi:MAG: EF-P lysine aminoacylase GenX, partial [Proteobacteria bacterium]|nr:EF-P lysine aminoacylase GenX [Pseudomonadota bacterium]